MQAERYIAAADIGSAKTALCVAKVEGDDVQVIFYREEPSDGVRYSGIFNPVKASGPLKRLIDAAQEELNIKILQLVIGLPRYNVSQESAPAEIHRTEPDTAISKEEIDYLTSMAIDDYPIGEDSKYQIYGAVVQSFSADNDLVGADEDEIVGMPATTVAANFKIFFGDKRSASNIDLMLNTIGVAPAYKSFTPTAISRAILTEAEKENGVALVEVGAGVTSVTIYKNGRLRHYSSIPFGGKSITGDIKYECGFTEGLAENIKLAYGVCLPDKLQSLSEKVIQINDDENGTYERLPVKYLSEIVTYRMKEIFDAILYLIQESGYADGLRNGVVLSGGGANLVNTARLLKEMSGYNVRIGFPRNQVFSSGGCAGVTETSAAACVGMVLEAKRRGNINCIESAVLPGNESPDKEEPTVTETELFNEGEVEVVPQSPKKPEGREGNKKPPIKWPNPFKKAKSKIEDMGQAAFDSLFGDSYDSMK